jgi:deazaflavin-dependent oxidoreductase (nitroreductase family)
VPIDTRPAIRLVTTTHELWYRATDGLVGGNVFGAPILLLTTTGRKSGLPRTTPLLYLRDGDDYVVIASYGGSDRDPEWWRNLRADDAAKVQAGRSKLDVRAHAASGDERSRLWKRITSLYPIYSLYERRTTREIPVVVLSAAPAAAKPKRKARAAT